MSARTPIERRLPGILADLSAAPYPDYADALLARTATARQRPGWAFIERWLPVSTASSAAAAAPRIPWRTVGALALLILTLVVGAILFAGSRQQPLPAPFGPAANGLIAYSAGGDIYTVDPVTGDERAIVTDPDADSDPVWSRDGTHLVFRRADTAQTGGQVSASATLYVVRPDGTELKRITPESMPQGVQQYSFSPDGREVIFVGNAAGAGDLYIAKSDGGGVRPLDVGMPASDPSYRPPDGRQVVFTGALAGDMNELGVYLVNADGSSLRNLVEPSRAAAAVYPLWSPDGQRIAYTTVDMTTGWGWLKAHTMMTDGTEQRALPTPADSRWNYLGGWSNDGTRLVVIRGYMRDGSGLVTAAIVPAHGSDTDVETARQSSIGNDSRPEFAPDDASILVIRPNWSGEPGTPLYVDSTTGVARSAPFAANKFSAWQRIASTGQ
jgi:Tol biopolymer transport system component